MVRDNCLAVRERIKRACSRAGRDPSTVALLAVSKNRNAEEIKQALQSGISDIAENRVQEAALKYEALRAQAGVFSFRWHLVGRLQTNKAKEAVRMFDLIHSVDSLRLLRELDKQAEKINKRQDILIEVKTSPEETKSGALPEETADLVRDAQSFMHLNVLGLMTIAPLVENQELARPYFRRLKELFDYINRLPGSGDKLSILSMGMSDDFEAAIEEGSNLVRIGRAIFEG